jgi:Tfp pilus assembly protein PilF
MSLLMEALKKAEEARRKAGDERAFPAPDTRDAMTSASLAGELDADAPMDYLGAAPDRAHLAGRPGAREVFAAKRVPRAGDFFWPLVGVGILALLGAGAWFLWQWQAIPPPLAAAPFSTPSLAAPAPVPVPLPDPANALPASSAFPLLAPSVEEGGVRRTPSPETDPSLPFAVTARPAERAPVSSAVSPGNARAARKEAASLRLTRTPSPTHALLESAYEALQSGRGEEARRAYEEALRVDGKNADALLGLATLAAREGRDEEAHGYYLRALEADPNDATARAGALGAGRPGDDEAAESRLKTLLSGQPDAPPLHFALGNLYARQRRWSEAQQAYFRAYAGDPGNPDLIFNLAVSLDHLRKDALAARYYRMALETASVRTAAFDRAGIEARLLELSR